MSGSGMIAARPEGLAVDMPGEPEGCASGWDALASDCAMPWDDETGVRLIDEAGISQIRLKRSLEIALGIIMLAAAKCTEVQALADCGRIDRDGADLFNRRYSESICEIVAELAPVLRERSN